MMHSRLSADSRRLFEDEVANARICWTPRQEDHNIETSLGHWHNGELKQRRLCHRHERTIRGSKKMHGHC